MHYLLPYATYGCFASTLCFGGGLFDDFVMQTCLLRLLIIGGRESGLNLRVAVVLIF